MIETVRADLVAPAAQAAKAEAPRAEAGQSEEKDTSAVESADAKRQKKDPAAAVAAVAPAPPADGVHSVSDFLDHMLLVPFPARVEGQAPARRPIIYLSGRRAGTEKQTRKWLQDHGFPLDESPSSGAAY